MKKAGQAVSGDTLFGAIGEISPERLSRLKQNLVRWLLTTQDGG